MTVALILKDRIVSDSRLNWGDTHHTVGKIFRRKDGALFTTAGDSRLTYSFERQMMAGDSPEPPEFRENADEEFEGVVLLPNGQIVTYDENFSPSNIAEDFTAIGSGGDVARSWLLAGLDPEKCIEKVFEVRNDCGPPVVTVMLRDGKSKRRGK